MKLHIAMSSFYFKEIGKNLNAKKTKKYAYF